MDNQDLTDLVGSSSLLIPGWAQLQLKTAMMLFLFPSTVLDSCYLPWLFFDIDRTTSSLHMGVKVALRKCFWIFKKFLIFPPAASQVTSENGEQ